MKKLILLPVLLLTFACQKKGESKVDDVNPAEVKKETVETRIDSITRVGEGKDAHGCETTAGYTWSELKGECVRVFEAGTRFDPIEKGDGAVMSAFVIFEENQGNRAELFVMSEEKPVILTRKSEGDSFVNGDWELFPWKGYVLRYKGKNTYRAD